jgi:arylsulfatase A-like enzyme
MRYLLLAVLLLAHALAQSPSNVLLVVADDLGVDYVGCYGEGTNPPPTPTIDALAQNGVLFRNAWANPSCSPTRACIQTGRYPFRTMVGRWIAHHDNPPTVGLLQPRERTLPELLDAAGSGYAHALIGKWHLHNAYASPDVPRTIGGYAHHAGSLEGQVPSYTNWTRVVDGSAAPCTVYCTTQNTDDALAWIAAQTGPWFCVLTYQAPHIPYHAPPAHLHTQNLGGLVPQPTTHTPANIPFYRAMVQSLDTELGRLFATLGPAVMAATNVIFVADNGTVQRQSVAPFDGTRSKGTPYEGGVNVPLVISGPIVQQPGREVTALACAVDVFATVLELTGARAALPPFAVHDSVSLVPYLVNPAQAPRRQFAYTEEFTGTAWPAPNSNGHATIRNDRYKLIHRYNGTPDEVYDLVADPWETVNLSNSTNATVQQNYAALSAEIARLRAGGGSAAENFVVFGGGGCQGWNGPLVVSASGNAAPGGAVDIRLLNGPPFFQGGVAFSALGLSWTEANGLSLPLDLLPFGGGPGCVLSSSVEAVRAVVTGLFGDAMVTVAIPNSASLQDLEWFGAWVCLDPHAPNSPRHLVTSPSVLVRIG